MQQRQNWVWNPSTCQDDGRRSGPMCLPTGPPKNGERKGGCSGYKGPNTGWNGGKSEGTS